MKRLLTILSLLAAFRLLAAPVQVVATVPDLGDLVNRIGGEQVTVTTLVKGPEDPHYLQARPSLIKAVSQAELLVLVGLDLESGWLPVLIRNGRNGAIQPGAPGYLDASTAIRPIHDQGSTHDRSAGHVHPLGNPHYLLDPINGLQVAMLVHDRLAAMRPDQADLFAERLADFRQEVGERLVGRTLATRYDAVKLAQLHARGTLPAFLDKTGERDLLGGWLGMLLPHGTIRAIDDHAMWHYFAARFNIEVVAHLEPKPGLTPTTRHLADVVKTVNEANIPVILTAAYFPARHAAFVARKTGATPLSMCHQTGAKPGAESYLAMVDHNIQTLHKALP